MSQQSFRAGRLVAISVLASLLGGCIVAAAPPHRYYVGTVVYTAPPPPRIEEYGPPPAVGYVWLGGYWRWGGDPHERRPGRLGRPHPHRRWVPPPRVARDGGSHLVL